MMQIIVIYFPMNYMVSCLIPFIFIIIILKTTFTVLKKLRFTFYSFDFGCTSNMHVLMDTSLLVGSADFFPLQKSNLLEITERTTPSWDHRTVVLPLQAEREGVAPGGPSTMCTPVGDGTHPNLQSTVELLRWMQETLVDAPTRTRLLEGENFFELLRNGLPLGLRNAVPSTPAVTSEATVAPSGDTESEEVESSCEITDLEISSEVGTSDTSGL